MNRALTFISYTLATLAGLCLATGVVFITETEGSKTNG